MRACVCARVRHHRRHEASSETDPYSVFCVHLGEGEGGRERIHRVQYVTLRPCGRQMCARVKLVRGLGRGEGGAGEECTRTHTAVHLHTGASVRTGRIDLLGVANLSVCVWVGGGRGVGGGGGGPQGTAMPPPPTPHSPSLAAWAGLGFRWGPPSCLCVCHRLTIPMYI